MLSSSSTAVHGEGWDGMHKKRNFLIDLNSSLSLSSFTLHVSPNFVCFCNLIYCKRTFITQNALRVYSKCIKVREWECDGERKEGKVVCAWGDSSLMWGWLMHSYLRTVIDMNWYWWGFISFLEEKKTFLEIIIVRKCSLWALVKDLRLVEWKRSAFV